MIARAAAALVIAGAAASCAEDVDFASIALTVREPQGQKRFGLSNPLTGLQWTIDRKFRASVAFDPGDVLEKLDINLGQEARAIDVLLFVGQKTRPRAVGRAGPFAIPALDQQDVTTERPLQASVFLAQPYVPERLVDSTPDVRVGTAACDSASGRVLLVGGADNAYFLNRELTVTDINRDFNAVGFTVACDFSDKDDLAIAVRGECSGDGEGGYQVHVGLGSGNPRVQTAVDDELCDPFVRTAGDVIWVAGANFVALHNSASGNQVDRTALPPELLRPVRHALVDDGTLIVQGVAANGEPSTFIVRRDGALIGSSEPVTVPRFLAADPSGQTIFFDDGTVGEPVVEGNNLSFPGARASGFTIEPVRIVVISANDEDPDVERVVGIDADGTLQIEGQAAIETRRESMAVTHGDALLLFGNLEGHDVLVAPLSAFELETLTPPPKIGPY